MRKSDFISLFISNKNVFRNDTTNTEIDLSGLTPIKKDIEMDSIFVSYSRGQKILIPVEINSGKLRFFVVRIKTDKYTELLNQRINEIGLPIYLNVQQNEVYLYIFFKKEILSKTAIEVTKPLLSCLGLYGDDNVEVFPDLSTPNAFIPLPYNFTVNLKEISMNNIDIRKIDEVEIAERTKSMDIEEMPPCICNMTRQIKTFVNKQDFVYDMITSLVIFYKKYDSDLIQDKVFAFNSALAYPLQNHEVRDIIQEVEAKEIAYKCQSLTAFCDKTKCKKSSLGLKAQKQNMFTGVELGTLYRYKTVTPYYEWEARLIGNTKYKRIFFENELKLLDQKYFIQQCVRVLNFAPNQVSVNEWQNIVNRSLINVHEITVDEYADFSVEADIKRKFYAFMSYDYNRTNKLQGLLTGRYIVQDGYNYFLLDDFIASARKNYKELTSQQIFKVLTDLGVKPTVFLGIECFKLKRNKQIEALGQRTRIVDSEVKTVPLLTNDMV